MPKLEISVLCTRNVTNKYQFQINTNEHQLKRIGHLYLLVFIWHLAFPAQSAGVVGERSNSGEAASGRTGGAVGSENVGLSSAQR
jgi:hypothetical protein